MSLVCLYVLSYCVCSLLHYFKLLVLGWDLRRIAHVTVRFCMVKFFWKLEGASKLGN